MVNDTFVKDLLNNPIVGYAYHKIILDENGKPIDYEYIEINDTFCVLTGLKKENIVGNTVRNLIPGIEKDEFNWIEFYGNIALEQTKTQFEQFSQPLNKWYRVYVYSNEYLYFTTLFIDITEMKQFYQELEIVNNNYKNFLNSLNENVLLFDFNGKILFLNENFSQSLGYNVDELIGKSLKIICPQVDYNLEEIKYNLEEKISKEYIWQLLDKHYETLYFNVRISESRWYGEKCIFCFLKDLS